MKKDEPIIVVIDEANAKKRIDVALSALTPFSRSMIQKLIYAQNIKLNNEPIAKANFVTEIGHEYQIMPPKTNALTIEPEEGELSILYEDDHIIVINKAADAIVHPGAGNYSGTMVNFLAHYSKLSDCGGMERLGVVHRLDKGVSGVIIFAKTNEAHIALATQFQQRTIKKEYLALCYGKISEQNGLLEDYIARSPHHRKKMACMQHDFIGKHNKQYDEDDEPSSGKHSVMEYFVQNCFYVDADIGFISQIQCFPHTGRMHQIRLQLSSRRLPIIGDTLYGKRQHKGLVGILGDRIALHARRLTFTHPISGQAMEIEAPVPEEFVKTMTSLQTV